MSKRGLNVLTTVVSVCPSSVGRLDGRLVKECTEVDVGRGMHTALGEPRCFMLKAVVSNEPCGMGPDNGRPIGVIVADGSQMSRVTRVMCQAVLRQGEGQHRHLPCQIVLYRFPSYCPYYDPLENKSGRPLSNSVPRQIRSGFLVWWGGGWGFGLEHEHDKSGYVCLRGLFVSSI